jgi:hypothetical protein
MTFARLSSPYSGTTRGIGAVKLDFSFKWTALAEAVLILVALLIIDYAFAGGTRFSGLNPHPFWAVVLLIAVQYGLQEGMAAAVLAGLFYLAGNVPEQSILETSYQYYWRILQLPVMWFVAAGIIGLIRQRQVSETIALQEKTLAATLAAEKLQSAVEKLQTAREQLEVRITEENNGLLQAFKMAMALQTEDPWEALLGVNKLVESAIGARQVAFYLLEPGKLNAFRIDPERGMEHFPANLTSSTPLVREVMLKRRLVTVATQEGEVLLDGLGLMAAPIHDAKTNRTFGILVVEECTQLVGLPQVQHRLQTVVNWIGRVFAELERAQGRLSDAEAVLAAQQHNQQLREPAEVLPFEQHTKTNVSAQAMA